MSDWLPYQIALDVCRLSGMICGPLVIVMAFAFWRGWIREPAIPLWLHTLKWCFVGFGATLLGAATFMSDRAHVLYRGTDGYAVTLFLGWWAFSTGIALFVVARSSRRKVAFAMLAALTIGGAVASYFDRAM